MNNPLTQNAEPWYRHRWPWFLMLGPFVVVVASAITAYFAVKTSDGLVEDDYYKQGLAINQVAVRDQAAADLSLNAEIIRGEEGGGGSAGGALRVLLDGKEGVKWPERLRLHLVHPTRAGVDQDVVLLAEGPGVYAGRSDKSVSGRWQVVLEDDARTWRLTGKWDVAKGASLRLSSSATAPVD